MKKKAVVIWIYALIVLIGGLIGYLTANSLPSLLASSVAALVLFICGFFMQKEQSWAYYAASLLVGGLLAFFAYRFFLTYKIMPAGVMVLLSGLVFGYLVKCRKCSGQKIC